MSEIVKEAVRAYHRMIDIVENDQRNRAANLITPSEIVNTEPNKEQAQTPQTTKVCSVPLIEIIDTDDENEHQKVRPIQNRSKSMSVVERNKRQLHQFEENKREKGEEQPSELCHHNVKKKRVHDVNSTMPRTSQSLEVQNNRRFAVRSYQNQKAIDLDLFELIESGRFIEKSKDIARMIFMLFSRFSKLEKPNGGSFYNLSHGMLIRYNGDCVQKANCYGHYKHKCPVQLKVDYKHDDSVYKIYKSGTHNHVLNHVKREKAKKRDTYEDIKIEIISSKIADYVKEEKIAQ